MVRHLVGCFESCDPLTEPGTPEALFDFVPRFAGADDQDRPGVADRRNDLVVVPVEMPLEASVTGVFRTAFGGGKTSVLLEARQDSCQFFVLTGDGRFVEYQATAEHKSFDDVQMSQMTVLAKKGIAELIAIQKAAIESA